MSLFAKVFDGTSPDHGMGSASFESSHDEPLQQDQHAAATVQAAHSAGSRFSSYIKESLLYGPPAKTEQESAPYVEDDEDEWDEDIEESRDLGVPEDDPEDVCEESVEPVVVPQTGAPKPQNTPAIIQGSAGPQQSSMKVEQIVDRLFDRMKGQWGDQRSRLALPGPKPTRTRPQKQQVTLAEGKNEIATTLRKELPRAMRGELVAIMRKEILSAVRGEIIRVVRDEFEAMGRLLTKTTDRLRALETSLARIEGSLGKEIMIKMPKGMVNVEVPITIPEREVKVAAPINVHPPNVVFDEGAISIQVAKGPKGQREVVFDRDRHNNIQGAKIVDAPDR